MISESSDEKYPSYGPDESTVKWSEKDFSLIGNNYSLFRAKNCPLQACWLIEIGMSVFTAFIQAPMRKEREKWVSSNEEH